MLALTGNDMRVVEGVQIGHPIPFGPGESYRIGIVEIEPFNNHLRIPGTQLVSLFGRCALWQINHCPGAGLPYCIGNGQTVIAA